MCVCVCVSLTLSLKKQGETGEQNYIGTSCAGRGTSCKCLSTTHKLQVEKAHCAINRDQVQLQVEKSHGDRMVIILKEETGMNQGGKYKGARTQSEFLSVSVSLSSFISVSVLKAAAAVFRHVLWCVVFLYVCMWFSVCKKSNILVQRNTDPREHSCHNFRPPQRRLAACSTPRAPAQRPARSLYSCWRLCARNAARSAARVLVLVRRRSLRK